jgi:hypothetical protein
MKTAPNTACTRSPQVQRGHGGGSRRVFKRFVWLEVGSVKMALSHPTHQRVTPAVGRYFPNYKARSKNQNAKTKYH